MNLKLVYIDFFIKKNDGKLFYYFFYIVMSTILSKIPNMKFFILALLAFLAVIYTACAFERHPHLHIPEDDLQYHGDDVAFEKHPHIHIPEDDLRDPAYDVAFERYPHIHLTVDDLQDHGDDDAFEGIHIPEKDLRDPAYDFSIRYRHIHMLIDDPVRNPADDFVKPKSLRQDAPTRAPVTVTHVSVKNYPLGDRVPDNFFSIGLIQVPLSIASDLACLKQNPFSFGDLDDPSNYGGNVLMTEPKSQIDAFIGVRSSGNYCIYIPVKQVSSFVEKLNGNINYQAETLALQIQQLSDKVDAYTNSTSILVENTTDSALLYAVIGIQFCGMALACVAILCYMKTRAVNVVEVVLNDHSPKLNELVVLDNDNKV